MIAVFALGALGLWLTVRAGGCVRRANGLGGCALSGLGLLVALAALSVAIHLH